MSTNVCRQGCWCRGGGGERAHIAGVFKPKSATGGAKESPVLMDSSSGGGASGDSDVVATGVVSRGEGGAGAGSGADVVVTGVVSKGEGGAGAGSFADVVATGDVNGLEDCEARALIWMVFSCQASLLTQECAINHPQGHSQETNRQARKQDKKKKNMIFFSGRGSGEGGVGVQDKFPCAPSIVRALILSSDDPEISDFPL